MTSQHDKPKRWRVNPRRVVGMKIVQYGVCMALVGIMHALGRLPAWMIERGTTQSFVFFVLAGIFIAIGFVVRLNRTE